MKPSITCWLISVYLCIFASNYCEATVKSGLDLYCNFESRCPGWRNGTSGLEDSGDWKSASSVIIDAWHSIPRPIQGGKFAYVVGSGRSEPETAWLVSDTIPCLQLQSFLTFFYWKNSFLAGLFNGGGPKLHVHLRQPPWTRNLRLLSDFSAQNKWGWHAAAVDIPATENPFQIVISAEYQSSYDVLGIDEILFRGYISDSYCNISARSERNQLSDGSSQPKEEAVSAMDTSLLQSQIARILPHLQASRQLGLGPADTEEFAAEDLLQYMIRIRNQQQPVKQQNAVLSPYTQPAVRSALEPLLQEMLRPFPSFSSGPATTTTTAPTPSADFQRTNDCTGVNCGFEGNSCNYEGTDGHNGAWVIMQGRIGNPITGITRAAFGRYYAVAYTATNSSTQILRSQNFTTNQQAFLTFWFYFATAESGRLVVCDLSLEHCHWEKTRRSVNSDSRRWRRGTILLPPGNHQVLFVVENLMEHHYVGLDQIYLRTHVTGPLAPCLLIS